MRSHVVGVLVILLCLTFGQGPSNVNAIPAELLQRVDGIIDTVNGFLQEVIDFPFLTGNLKERLQRISTALENRDFIAAVGEIRDLISSKFSSLKKKLSKTNFGQLAVEMEKVNKVIRNLTSTLSEGMDKEIDKMKPIMMSSLPPELANRIRTIVDKIRNATIKAENFRLTLDVVKQALRRIREKLDADNVLSLIQTVRNVAKSSFASILSQGQSSDSEDLIMELDEINFEAMALQIRAEEAAEALASTGAGQNVPMPKRTHPKRTQFWSKRTQCFGQNVPSTLFSMIFFYIILIV